METEKQLRLEREFLALVGFDLSNGYYQHDFNYYKDRYLWLWVNLVKLRNKAC